MRTISLLDCTLRDGGCVNDFNFGESYMNQIFDGVQKSGVEIIECGYIDENKGSASGRTQFINDEAISDTLLRRKTGTAKYVAMIDYGKYDVSKLQQRNEYSIDGIRLAFHKKNCREMIEWGKIILEKGYDLYIQPMLVMRYTDRELIDFIDLINEELPQATAFYIVDSFGEMRAVDLKRVVNIVDHNLISNMSIGFHSHNNLQLSYSNATTLLEFSTQRNLIFDVSILGMGKGAGNLNAEIFAEHLNIYHEKSYDISAMLEVIDKVLNQIKQDYSWGYSVEYYLSSINRCTPSYAGYFYKKHTLSIDEIAVLLSEIEEEKKISFDREYARKIYYQFVGKKIDDTKTIDKLKERFEGKDVVLVAPGKSISENLSELCSLKGTENKIVVSVNHVIEGLADYVFVTKKNTYEMAKDGDATIIATSNVTTNESQLVVNYDKYNNLGDEKVDISIVLLFNLLKELKVNSVALAGFDGFKADMGANYYSENLMRPVTKEIAEMRNTTIKRMIGEASKEIKITFLTDSLYQ